MTDAYRAGRIDGLREAVEIVRALEADVARKLEREAPICTRNVRRVRRQTYHVAATRITTALKRRDQKKSEFPTVLRRLGL